MEDNIVNYPILTKPKNGCMTVITENDDGTLNYESLIPGQFDKAKQLLSEEQCQLVQELWTEEVIIAWKDSIKQSCEEING